MRSVTVVFGLVFAFDFGTNRPVIAERTAVLKLRFVMAPV